jgi:hypothetical protein
MTLQKETKITKGDLSVGERGKRKALFYGGALTRRRYRGLERKLLSQR